MGSPWGAQSNSRCPPLAGLHVNLILVVAANPDLAIDVMVDRHDHRDARFVAIPERRRSPCLERLRPAVELREASLVDRAHPDVALLVEHQIQRTDRGSGLRDGQRVSTTLPVSGSSIPRTCVPKSAYQIMPSASAAASCGSVSGRGRSYSVMMTGALAPRVGGKVFSGYCQWDPELRLTAPGTRPFSPSATGRLAARLRGPTSLMSSRSALRTAAARVRPPLGTVNVLPCEIAAHPIDASGETAASVGGAGNRLEAVALRARFRSPCFSSSSPASSSNIRRSRAERQGWVLRGFR